MIKHFIVATLCASFIATSAEALQMNITVDQDIQQMKDSNIALSYKLYSTVFSGDHGEGHTSQLSFSGMPLANFNDFMTFFNNDHASEQPGDGADGSHSIMTLGYGEADKTIYPESCKAIVIKPITNILLTKTGCIVS